MHILIVSPHYWPEPFRVPDLAAGLKQRGHDIEILTALPNYPAGRFYPGYGLSGPYRERFEGIQITRVPVVPRGAGTALRLVMNYASFAAAASVRALTLRRRHRWDVVFVFQSSPVTAILPAVLIKALFGVPVVAWVQDLWPESIASAGFARSRLLYSAARRISGWLYRRCDRVMGTSQAFQPRLEALGVPAHRFEYAPQWAEPFFTECCSRDQAPRPSWAGGFPVVFAGNLGRVQALETLVAAAELLRDDEEVRWVFVGDGSKRAWLEQEVVRRRLAGRVVLVGRRPAQEMPALYAHAGALVVSLQRDDTMALTIPAKVQACLASGRPIIGSIDGEAARVIVDSGGGWVAPAGDAVSLAETVRRMKALPPVERDLMGRRAQAYFAREFSRDRCLDQFERAFSEAAAHA